MTNTIAGDDSFTAWYAETAPAVLRTVVAMTGDRDLAQDLTAEAFATALRRWDHLQAEVNSPDDWVFRVAINLVRRHWRRRAVRGRVPFGARPGATGEAAMPDVDLWRAVARLPRRQREVIVLRYLADMTEPAIARTLDLTPGAVSANLNKARTALRSLLEPGAPHA